MTTEETHTLTDEEVDRIAREAAKAAVQRHRAEGGEVVSPRAMKAMQAAARDEIQRTEQARGVTLTDDDADRIADRTIRQLEERGAFAQPEPPPPATPQPGSEGDQGESEGQTQERTGQPPSGGEGPPAPEPEPRRRSFAERFQGKR